MKRPTSTLLSDESGATAIEYGLIVSLIVIAMMASLIQVANVTIGMWNGVSDRVEESTTEAVN
ncbi:MAG TPA: Flp family type IVb pilin [Allosphingosinicella sp.]|nr:Flp family type IVb pilin [Allosphingosinicella sp.]